MSMDAITYVFRWRTFHDHRTCETCLALADREWRNQTLDQPVLDDPRFGPVWDLQADHSLAHGLHRFNCRCNLEIGVHINLDNIVEYVAMIDTLERGT